MKRRTGRVVRIDPGTWQLLDAMRKAAGLNTVSAMAERCVAYTFVVMRQVLEERVAEEQKSRIIVPGGRA